MNLTLMKLEVDGNRLPLWSKTRLLLYWLGPTPAANTAEAYLAPCYPCSSQGEGLQGAEKVDPERHRYSFDEAPDSLREGS